MIIADYSQVLIAACLVDADEYKVGGDTKRMEMITRHKVLNSFLSYKKQFGAEFGNTVLAADGGNTWRKQFFPAYKHGRSKARSESDIDWKSIFAIGKQIRTEIAETFPIKTVWVDEAEADDVFGVLVKYTQDNELKQDGLEETPQPVMGVSSDHDIRQLYLKYQNYKQWSPLLKKAVPKPDKNFLVEKILTGDPGDAIPNIRSPLDFYLTDVPRQKPITKAMKEKFLLKKDGSSLTEEERKRFDENKTLIDFDRIPDNVSEQILNTYINQTPVRSKEGVLNYMLKHRLKLLTPRLEEFF